MRDQDDRAVELADDAFPQHCLGGPGRGGCLARRAGAGPGARARHAASATSLRWPPDSSRVGGRSRPPRRARARAGDGGPRPRGVAAGGGPAPRAGRSWCAQRARPSRRGRRRAPGSASLDFGARPRSCSSARQLRPRGRARWRSGRARVAGHELREEGVHEPAPPGRPRPRRASLQPGRIRRSVDLPPPVRPDARRCGRPRRRRGRARAGRRDRRTTSRGRARRGRGRRPRPRHDRGPGEGELRLRPRAQARGRPDAAERFDDCGSNCVPAPRCSS